MQTSEVQKCKRCDKPIVFTQRFGKPHPMDVEMEGETVINVLGSHFDTCEFAYEFRSNPKKSKKSVVGQEELEHLARNFNFTDWFRRRHRPYTRHDQPQRPGTKVISREQTLIDGIYDFRRQKTKYGHVIPEKMAKSVVLQAIEDAKADKIIGEDESGLFLVGERRVRTENGLTVYKNGKVVYMHKEIPKAMF